VAELDQAQRRKPIVLKDQFGRKWDSTLDTISNGTCAPINPKGWVDPLNTPSKYVRLAKDEDGNLSLDVQLEQWAAQLEQDHKEYDQRLYNDAMMLFGAEGPKAYEDRSPALMNYTGGPPQAIEPVWAAIDRNSYALGLTTVVDERVAKYFPKKERVRPSFRDLDPALDVEEQHDPEALGGKRVPVGPSKKEKAQRVA
jgi:hypothetical protein